MLLHLQTSPHSIRSSHQVVSEAAAQSKEAEVTTSTKEHKSNNFIHNNTNNMASINLQTLKVCNHSHLNLLWAIQHKVEGTISCLGNSSRCTCLNLSNMILFTCLNFKRQETKHHMYKEPLIVAILLKDIRTHKMETTITKSSDCQLLRYHRRLSVDIYTVLLYSTMVLLFYIFH